MSTKKPSPTSAGTTTPDPLSVVAQYIRDTLFPKRQSTKSNDLPTTALAKETMEKYRNYFPGGTIAFKIPRDARDKEPSHWYHSIEDTTLLFVQWELNFPGIKLNCTKVDCSGEFIHSSSEFSKNGNLYIY